MGASLLGEVAEEISDLAGVRTLLASIEKKEVQPRRVAIEGPLIVRGSARKPEDWSAKEWEG